MSPIKPFGLSAGGEEIPQPQRPTLCAQAKALATARVNKTNAPRALVTPEIWGGCPRGDYAFQLSLTFGKTDPNQFTIEAPPSVVSRCRRVYGFIVNCMGASSSVAPTAYLFNVVLKFPIRFAGSATESDDAGEFADSHFWAWAIDFSNMVCSDTPVCSFRMGGSGLWHSRIHKRRG